MFSLIGDVILQSTDKSYGQWLLEAIFEPLKMSDASLGFEQMVNDKNYALPHVRSEKRWHSAGIALSLKKIITKWDLQLV